MTLIISARWYALITHSQASHRFASRPRRAIIRRPLGRE